MSEYINRRATNHEIKHVFSGKYHFFEVASDSGETHNVSVQINCDCTFYSLKGAKDAKLCSHALSVIRWLDNETSKDK